MTTYKYNHEGTTHTVEAEDRPTALKKVELIIRRRADSENLREMTPRIEAFRAYINERQTIFNKRAAGEKAPWTKDDILLNYRFCNVFREDDTVTVWVEENIRKPFADHPNLWVMLAIARYINWPPTLAHLITYPDAWPSSENFDPKDLGQGLEEWSANNKKTYTGAYMIRAESDQSKEWYSWSKNRYIAEIVIGSLWEDRDDWEELLENNPTLEEVWDKFQQPTYRGFGPFMAYEVVTDLRHTRYCRNASDIYLWANAGPGAIRGLNRLYGRPLNQQPKRAQTNDEMLKLMTELNEGMPEAFAHVEKFEMRDVEHNLCEFDKYERVRLGEGKPRSLYNGRG